jgi:hypothetical protein
MSCCNFLARPYFRSTFEVDTRDLEKPTLKLEVMIDGSAVYRYVSSFVFVTNHSEIPFQPHDCGQASQTAFFHSTRFFSSTKLQQNVPQDGSETR